MYHIRAKFQGDEDVNILWCFFVLDSFVFSVITLHAGYADLPKSGFVYSLTGLSDEMSAHHPGYTIQAYNNLMH